MWAAQSGRRAAKLFRAVYGDDMIETQGAAATVIAWANNRRRRVDAV